MIITRLYGGMGNQMFQYALGRVLAIKNNTTLGLDTHDLLDRTPRTNFIFRNYDLDLFNIQARLLPQKEVPIWYGTWRSGVFVLFLNKIIRKILPNKGREKVFEFDKNILSLQSPIYLDGYWQSPLYFEDYKDVIRQDLTISAPLSDKVLELRKEIESKNSVCLHVRRGDYVGNSYHDVVNSDYYERALKILAEKTTIGHLYVFSDDIVWCKENMHFEYPVTFVENEYAGERAIGHFALMRACKHFIIPNSSFSWWAAWLGEGSDKIVIAPKQWFGSSNVATVDLIPENWIRV